MSTDSVVRFLFEELDIRGAVVKIDDTWRRIRHGREYPQQVQSLLGQMSAITAIIAANLKTPGRITFQLSGDGEIGLMVLDCSAELNLRGYAQCHSQFAHGELASLLGNGRLLLSLDVEGARQPFQSYVPIEGQTIAAVFEHYLAQSEQQPALLFLAADAETAAGLFLQKLPGADERDPDGWHRISQLAATLTDGELLSLTPEMLLMRLFHEETIRCFTPRPVTHHFPPDWERVRSTLRALGRAEIESILAEHGEVVVRDDLSNHTYRFDEHEARALFDQPPPTLH